jgi:hypothetical protein
MSSTLRAWELMTLQVGILLDSATGGVGYVDLLWTPKTA